MIAKLEGHKYRITKKQGPNTAPIQAIGATITMNQQLQDHRLRTGRSLSHWGGGGGLNAFYWYQTFAQDSVTI